MVHRCLERPHACECGWRGKVLRWTLEQWNEDGRLNCPACGARVTEVFEAAPNRAVGVIPDDIPGGIEIRHGLCNDDGSPRRYDSKTEIRREAARRGMVIHGETPNTGSRWF